MKTFTDSQARTWAVAVDVAAVKRARGLAGVDLLDAANGDLLARLDADPCLLVDVLYALCKPEADGRQVADEDFGRAMAGGVLDDAASALVEELLDFFPRAPRARALKKLVDLLQVQGAALKAVAEALGPPAPASIPGEASGGSPAPSALTPAP